VRWQIGMGLWVHLLMRFLEWQSQRPPPFGRLFVLARGTRWHRWDSVVIVILIVFSLVRFDYDCDEERAKNEMRPKRYLARSRQTR
jgi:hypothetical protein